MASRRAGLDSRDLVCRKSRILGIEKRRSSAGSVGGGVNDGGVGELIAVFMDQPQEEGTRKAVWAHLPGTASETGPRADRLGVPAMARAASLADPRVISLLLTADL
jgi:hypothetical protein